MNGNGKPVGGTKPVTTATFKRTWINTSDATPAEIKHPNLSVAFLEIFIIHKNNKTNNKTTNIEPTKPVSSAIIENIKSDSENGKNKYFCLELNIPTPNKPPREIPKSDWTSWKPSPLLDANGSTNATSLLNLYGSTIINRTTTAIAGITIIKKCLALAPPIKSITTIKHAMQIVIDIFGSIIISKQFKTPTNNTGKIPLNDLTDSVLFESNPAEKIIKANFAISDGWNVITLKLIQRVAP